MKKVNSWSLFFSEMEPIQYHIHPRDAVSNSLKWWQTYRQEGFD